MPGETTIDATAEVHPSAVVDESASIGAGSVIGPGVIVGPRVRIGAGNTLHARCVIQQDTSLGDRNAVHPFVILGGDPQDRAYSPEAPGGLVIGDDNIFREYVSVHRATVPDQTSELTRIGNRNFLMASSHVGHNCVVGDGNTLANSTALSGHVRLGSGCVLSGTVGVHQFVNVGDGSMFQFGAGLSSHAPPYCVYATGINVLVALNSVGLARNPEITASDRSELKEVFRAVFRRRGARPMETVAEELLERRAWGAAATNFLTFIRERSHDPDPRRSKRGICGLSSHRG
jgi:UDP-N-acetylglucosamine acyltransferase